MGVSLMAPQARVNGGRYCIYQVGCGSSAAWAEVPAARPPSSGRWNGGGDMLLHCMLTQAMALMALMAKAMASMAKAMAQCHNGTMPHD